jgi:hypothetical protein
MIKEVRDLNHDLHVGWWIDSRGDRIFVQMTTHPDTRDIRGFSISGDCLKNLKYKLNESEQLELMQEIWVNRQEVLDTISPVV